MLESTGAALTPVLLSVNIFLKSRINRFLAGVALDFFLSFFFFFLDFFLTGSDVEVLRVAMMVFREFFSQQILQPEQINKKTQKPEPPLNTLPAGYLYRTNTGTPTNTCTLMLFLMINRRDIIYVINKYLSITICFISVDKKTTFLRQK